ncbi:MAG: signal peptidase I [Sulfurimicrobium sp.]|jgi:signal peptidase I|nr:signal peptidase I [Sulfurimicrobium sp.]MDP1704841.1 signal peptidase I [Sulfurimicrobium sp.]MDP1896603.1 signal peptidase I [Sulfurimicrobium sp.]MDP2197239.1 signal peptidase I [Sulfurimicrobium sp.]MDP2963544.1 signal peptidase I [Sulfurimicrobium sp.]
MNFALIMLIALLVTGAIWLFDIYLGKPRRAKEAKEPVLVEYARSFFPVILVVFMLRSFLVEPFKIPSGSMLPTLLVGDFILVNKYTYGIRLPVVNAKIVDINQPQRGDVMVFRYPEDTSLDYIKRVVGLPGDRVVYRGKRLFINGQAMKMEDRGEKFNYVKSGLNYVTAMHAYEQLGSHQHAVLVLPDLPPVRLGDVKPFPSRTNCDYNEDGFSCTVPDGHYFMMGDNRDDSNDSRYWGFVPDRNIVGKAFMVWWNFGDFKRIGQAIN